MRQTKIVATIGPASEGRTVLPRLLRAGVDVVRLNFSHGDYREMRRIVRDVRAFEKRTGRPIAIMQDLQGPKVRVGLMGPGTVLADRATVTLTTDTLVGDATTIPVQYKGLPADVRRGDTILLDDGLIELRVVSTTPRHIRARVIHGGPLESHKGINVPTASLNIPAVTPKDRQDLAFGLSLGVDFVALSFVKTAADVTRLKRRIARAGSRAQVIAKIEKHEAVKNLGEIVDAADAVMVARGDLGVEMRPEEVPLIQKRIIHLANRSYKPVITATQMLESMIVHPRATRAEVSDVANAILDGSDAVMLSAETATGAYPKEAVEVMAHTATQVEQFFSRAAHRTHDLSTTNITAESMGVAVCDLAQNVNAKAIVCPTSRGWTARVIARHRLRKRVVALTSDQKVARQLTLTWGVQPSVVRRYKSVDEMTKLARQFVISHKVAKAGERIVVTSGIPLHRPGTTNMVQVHTL